MKLVKKIISTVCAIGMVATAMSSLMVAEAATPVVPTLKITYNEESYDPEIGEGVFTVYLENLGGDDESVYENLSLWAYNIGFMFDSDEFELSYYEDGRTGVSKNVTLNPTYFGTGLTGKGLDGERLTIQWAQNHPKSGLSPFDGVPFDSLEVATINFKVKSTPATITIANTTMVQVDEMDDDFVNSIQQFKFGNATSSCTPMNYEFPTIPGVEFVVPEAQGTEVSGDQILDVKPSDIGGTGDVFTTDDPDFAGEAAIASLANFAAMGSATKVEWKISATPVGGEATEYVKDFDLGATIDSATTIGIIVGYDTAEYSSVEVISGMLK